ncbi:ABC transporter ATP-binding protein [Corticibacter populi]|uniref:ABC transporter ATP-binding protein n=2 Tax=Corticibacter populi TaxID=1550736 RepID=A0A3M6QSP4_9BURK|nr:ABC transporter ATP-binding protein [Corticibacter populi]
MAAPWLHMRGIVKRFPGVLANDDAHLAVRRGEIHALLGENGAGKSTLMQILYGLYQADAGEITLDGQPLTVGSPADAMAHGIGMVHQEFMLVRLFTVAENVALADRQSRTLDLAAVAARITEVSQQYGLQIDPQARIEQLPIGVQQRVEIVKLLCRDARILILDEPTAVLTAGEKDRLFAVLRRLASDGCAIIIVTHKLHEILEIAERVTVMRAGKTVGCVPTAGSSEAALARLMVGRDVTFTAPRPVQTPGPVVLQVEDLSTTDERGQQALRQAGFCLRAGEILGIAGVDGNGQSELAEALVGARPSSGSVRLHGREMRGLDTASRRALGMAYIPADRRRAGAVMELSVRENALLGMQNLLSHLAGLWRDEARISAHAQRLVETFGVRTASLSFPAGKLSGGNLQKLILGRELMLKPQLLVVEQPTRGLDVGAIEVVWQALLAERQKGTAIVLVSAELDEILTLSDRVAVLYGGRIAGLFDNDGSAALRESIGLCMAGVGASASQADAAANQAALPEQECHAAH